MAQDTGQQSFWEHLDELRTVILRSLAVTVTMAVVVFLFKDQLFAVVLAPRDGGFVTYRLFERVAQWQGVASESLPVQLINTGLARQFVIHVKTALCAGVICASPYILYQLFRFVSPALYAGERRYATRVVIGSYLMFALGVLVSYFLIFPCTFRFLGTYQVSGDVVNMIALDSYISTLMTMSLAMGIVFEIPILAWFFAKLGFISASLMRRYRKHAIIAMFTIAAVITPTSDVFTLSIVALPMCLLYEFSILVVSTTDKASIK